MSSKSRRKFLCIGCKVDTGKIYEHYFLKNDVWYQVHNSNVGMFCIGCFENRLGRKLTPEDFPPVTINNPRLCKMSQRSLDRICN